MENKENKIDLTPLNEVEKWILRAIPDTLLDKLQYIKDIESISILSRNYMSEEDRVMMVSKRRAFDELIQTIKSLKVIENSIKDSEERKQKASTIRV